MSELQLLNNRNFDSGLTNWSFYGSVTIAAMIEDSSNNCLKLGQGGASIQQKQRLGANQVVSAVVSTKTPSRTSAQISLAFYNDNDVLLRTDSICTKNHASYADSTIYTQSPVFTSYVILSMENESDAEEVIYIGCTSLIVIVSDGHLPSVNIDEYELPLWGGDTVYGETVLMYGTAEAITGKLLYIPTEMISVTDD
jgi:hypothetical protein